jgi:putative ABC transport system permease protein
MVTYALLREDANVTALEAKIPQMVKTHGAEVLEYFIGTSLDNFIAIGGRWFFQFQPITNIRLHSQDIGNPLGSLGDIKYIYIFMAVAIFVLLIACINFINLTTARSAHRAKEVGIRKTLGSQKWQLRWQFLTESLLYSIFALIVGLAFTELFQIILNRTIGITIPSLSRQMLLFAVLLAVAASLLAGSYPAFYLTAFNPVEVLKGKISNGVKSSQLRNLLVVSQFAISIALIICTLLVHRQLEYVQNLKLGFDKENVLVISYAERLGNSLEAFQQSLKSHASVAGVSHSTSIPGHSAFGDFYKIERKD